MSNISTSYFNLIRTFAGDQLAIGKETGRRLGMGTNMYPSSSLLGESKDETFSALPVDDLIEKADGFAGVFPGKLAVVTVEHCEFFILRQFLIPSLPL